MYRLYRFFIVVFFLWCSLLSAETITEPLYSFPPPDQVSGHTDIILNLAISPDGSMIASSSRDDKVILWDAETGTKLHHFPSSGPNWNVVAFSPDGQLLAVHSKNDIILWNMSDGTEFFRFKDICAYYESVNTCVNSVQFSPDGITLAAAFNGNILKFWDYAAKSELYTVDAKNISEFIFSKDGKSIIFYGYNSNIIKTINISTRSIVDSFSVEETQYGIQKMALSPDGKTLAVVTGFAGSIELWDLQTSNKTSSSPVYDYNGWVKAVEFSPDGNSIAFDTYNNVSLRDISTKSEIKTFTGSIENIETIAFSPDGSYIVAGGSDDTVLLWDTDTSQITHSLGYNLDISAMDISPDGKYLATGSENLHTISLWDTSNGSILKTFTGTNRIGAVKFSPDGKTIASGSFSVVDVWDVDTGSKSSSFNTNFGWITSLDFSPDGESIVTGVNCYDIPLTICPVKVWDLHGNELKTFSGHTGIVISVTFSPDGFIVASGSDDGTTKLWDMATGTALKTFESPTGQRITSVAFSPDGNILAIGDSGDLAINLWNIESDTKTLSVDGYIGNCGFDCPLSFSPGGDRMASIGWTSGHMAVKVWNTKTGETTHTFIGHTGNIYGLAFSPSGDYIYSGSEDRTIKVWDTGEQSPIPPVASFTATLVPGELKINVDGSTSTDPDGGEIYAEWRVDGMALGTNSHVLTTTSTNNGLIRIIEFSTPGDYAITLIVTNESGLTAEMTRNVELPPLAPVASFTAVPEGVSVAVDGSASYDPDGGAINAEWQVDGAALGTGSNILTTTSTNNGLIRTIEFTTPGTYAITLVVTDEEGLSDETTQNVLVDGPASLPPAASFTLEPDPAELMTVRVDGSASSDPDGDAISAEWQADGSLSGSDEWVKTIEFSAPGDYTITLKVTDTGGLFDQMSQTVEIPPPSANQPPVASFTVTPDSADPLAVAVDGSTSSDPDGDKIHAEWQAPGSLSGADEWHKTIEFSAPGNYTVTLTVTDAEGLSVRTSQEVSVDDNRNALSISPPQHQFKEIPVLPSSDTHQTRRRPNDPDFSEQWGLENEGQSYEDDHGHVYDGLDDADIDAPEAWDIVQGSEDVVCAVIDSGVDYTHPDLAANMWTNPGEIPGNGKDDDGNGYADDVYGWDFIDNDNDPMDDHGHGTHVAGIMAAVGNNEIGISGVSWSGRVMAIRVMKKRLDCWPYPPGSCASGPPSAVVQAIEYVMATGVKCINASFGTCSGVEGLEVCDQLKSRVQAFAAQGGLLIAAAGNDGLNNDRYPSYPASYPMNNIISVCASDNRDKLTAFSHYGKQSVDLCAPGEYIYSTLPQVEYAPWHGTSMATPHVAGAAMLLWAAQPALTAAQVKALLMASADPISHLQGKTVSGGRLNLATGLADLPEPQDFTVTNTGTGTISLSSVRVEGQDRDDFTILHDTCHGDLEPGAGCMVKVHFTPATAGSKQAVLTISGLGNASVTTPLAGNATAVNFPSGPSGGPFPFALPSFDLDTAQADLPSIYVAGSTRQQLSGILCLQPNGTFEVCDASVFPGDPDAFAQNGHALFDPESGILEIPYIRLADMPDAEQGEIVVGIDGYSVKLALQGEGNMKFVLKELIPVW